MEIQWFPGHMTKTKKMIKENIKKVDVVIEILDARAPESSRNPLLDQLTGHKPRVVVLNKDDLADPRVTARWAGYYRSLGIQPVRVSSTQRQNIDKIAAACKKVSRRTTASAVKAMVVGIPNVGKSTLLNALLRRKKAAVGNTPGLTRSLQVIKAEKGLMLLDTPGILWHKFEDQEVGIRLAILGTIRDAILPVDELADYLAGYLSAHYGDRLLERFGWEDVPPTPAEIIAAVGAQRGMLQKGGIVDTEKAAMALIKETRDGKLGRISLEAPPAKEETQEADGAH